MNADQLFANTLSDIENRVVSGTEHDSLMIAAGLRKLLLDGKPLLDAANLERRVKLRFVVNDRNDDLFAIPGLAMWSVEDGLDPSVCRHPKQAALTRDQFLRQKVAYISGHWISVKDIILQFANIEGGVHLGEPVRVKEEAAHKVTNEFDFADLPWGCGLVNMIARIVLVALQPLRAVVDPTCDPNPNIHWDTHHSKR